MVDSRFNSSLQELLLELNNIDDSGIVAIGEALRCANMCVCLDCVCGGGGGGISLNFFCECLSVSGSFAWSSRKACVLHLIFLCVLVGMDIVLQAQYFSPTFDCQSQ